MSYFSAEIKKGKLPRLIVVVHDGAYVSAVENGAFFPKEKPQVALKRLSGQHPDDLIGWCHIDCRDMLDTDRLLQAMVCDKQMYSFSKDGSHYLHEGIGYAESGTCFIKVSKSSRYPTWRMSSDCGVTHARVLKQFKADVAEESESFGYFLNSLAKRAMLSGVMCYWQPNLLPVISQEAGSGKKLSELYRFVRQHYRLRWVFLLLMNRFVHDRKFDFLPALKALCYKSRNIPVPGLCAMPVTALVTHTVKPEFDVLIPTLGRAKYLHDVLIDLAAQTILPKKVIIIEQIADPEGVSELDYVKTREWPFLIHHELLRQPGACNARNVGLDVVESELLFMADDDIRFPRTLLEEMHAAISVFDCAVLPPCLTGNQTVDQPFSSQAAVFGSGHAFVKKNWIANIRFDMGFEFGYGEDSDFGIRLRNTGIDVVRIPAPEMQHLKAPVGGFRYKPEFIWSKENPQPKPSPTVMLYHLKHSTREQMLGYKSLLFLRTFTKKDILSVSRKLKTFRQKWDVSVKWAHKLADSNP